MLASKSQHIPPYQRPATHAAGTCLDTYFHTRLHTWVHTCRHTCVCTRWQALISRAQQSLCVACTHTCAQYFCAAQVHVCPRIHSMIVSVHMPTRMHIHMSAHMQLHMVIRMYTHMHIHMFMHMPMHMSLHTGSRRCCRKWSLNKATLETTLCRYTHTPAHISTYAARTARTHHVNAPQRPGTQCNGIWHGLGFNVAHTLTLAQHSTHTCIRALCDT